MADAVNWRETLDLGIYISLSRCMVLETGLCSWATSLHHFPNICDLSVSGQRNERQSSLASEKQVQEGRETMQLSLHTKVVVSLEDTIQTGRSSFCKCSPFRMSCMKHRISSYHSQLRWAHQSKMSWALHQACTSPLFLLVVCKRAVIQFAIKVKHEQMAGGGG